MLRETYAREVGSKLEKKKKKRVHRRKVGLEVVNDGGLDVLDTNKQRAPVVGLPETLIVLSDVKGASRVGTSGGDENLGLLVRVAVVGVGSGVGMDLERGRKGVVALSGGANEVGASGVAGVLEKGKESR